MNPIDIIGLAGWITLAVFVIVCGLIALAVGPAASRGDRIALRANEDREIDQASRR